MDLARIQATLATAGVAFEPGMTDAEIALRRIAAPLALAGALAPACNSSPAPFVTDKGNYGEEGCEVVMVPATSSIFDADQAAPTLPGATLPPIFTVEWYDSGSPFIEVPYVSGDVDCCDGTPLTSPEGEAGTTDLDSLNGISGIQAPRQMFLAGVFTNGSRNSGPTPPALDFRSLGTNFQTISPALFQTFFMGDGEFTVDGGMWPSGQMFTIPEGATRLYLGFARSDSFSGAPGGYSEAVGGFAVRLCPRSFI